MGNSLHSHSRNSLFGGEQYTVDQLKVLLEHFEALLKEASEERASDAEIQRLQSAVSHIMERIAYLGRDVTEREGEHNAAEEARLDAEMVRLNAEMERQTAEHFDKKKERWLRASEAHQRALADYSKKLEAYRKAEQANREQNKNRFALSALGIVGPPVILAHPRPQEPKFLFYEPPPVVPTAKLPTAKPYKPFSAHTAEVDLE